MWNRPSMVPIPWVGYSIRPSCRYLPLVCRYLPQDTRQPPPLLHHALQKTTILFDRGILYRDSLRKTRVHIVDAYSYWLRACEPCVPLYSIVLFFVFLDTHVNPVHVCIHTSYPLVMRWCEGTRPRRNTIMLGIDIHPVSSLERVINGGEGCVDACSRYYPLRFSNTTCII